MADQHRILVVEDDPVLRNLLSRSLADRCTAIFANSGEEAIAALEKETPALVVLDLVLPGMDGFSVLEQIRSRSDNLRNVPVVVVSNLGQQDDIQRATRLGANDYLVKAEVSVDEIISKIDQFIPH